MIALAEVSDLLVFFYLSSTTFALSEGRKPIDFVIKIDQATGKYEITVHNKVQQKFDP